MLHVVRVKSSFIVFQARRFSPAGRNDGFAGRQPLKRKILTLIKTHGARKAGKCPPMLAQIGPANGERIASDNPDYHATTLDSVSSLFEGEIRNRS